MVEHVTDNDKAGSSILPTPTDPLPILPVLGNKERRDIVPKVSWAQRPATSELGRPICQAVMPTATSATGSAIHTQRGTARVLLTGVPVARGDPVAPGSTPVVVPIPPIPGWYCPPSACIGYTG